MSLIVLASASPRRAELLTQMGVGYTVSPAHIDETPRPNEAPSQYVQRMAREKALAVYRDDDGIVVGADTSVVLAERILGKPNSAAEAVAMLQALSGAHHQVLTAVAVATRGECRVKLVTTDVRFRALSGEEIEAYVATGEPMDKAGSYGIQGLGGIFVDHIRGSYSAVVGLPLQETAELLAAAGLPVWQAWRRNA
ncbi:MAG: Maf family protein [Marinobacter sp.]|uniref:Maf family protein n=1 Tax=Marinobacter sp. TaxID=50741 RepID=UPI00299D61CD|nr:Maf family protein [Marinobacter sp.]MDX1756737.1 Maf family protein [Marinobacter sp.]